MDVPLSCLGKRYQNLWDQKKHTDRQKDNNIEFFFQTEAPCDVVFWYHQICVATVHKYMNIINFQAGAHNMILEPKKDPARQAHNAGFMVIGTNVDDIIKC